MDEDDVARLRAALARIARYLDRQSANEGLTRTETSALGRVARHGSIRVGLLAELEGVNPTMASRVVAKLEAAGYVTRTPDDEDRRVAHVSLTPAGARLHARRRRERGALLAARLAQLPPGHAEQLLGALEPLESLADALAPAGLQQAAPQHGALASGRAAR